MRLLIPARGSPGKSALGRQQGCTRLGVGKNKPASSKFSLCARSRSPRPSLQVGAFSWRDFAPQWGVGQQSRAPGGLYWESGTGVRRPGSLESPFQEIISFVSWIREV